MPPRKSTDAGGLTPVERRVHTVTQRAPDHTLTGDELGARLSDVPIEEQLFAINALLKKSLFNAQKGPNGIQYVALSKGEASLLGSMDGNELIIFNHIKEAKNEGIWTKVIKARTNLHQTIMTRCLKLLEQKQLVKSVKSVKFPTRKIYMLYDLTPSIELSGGPWYTDNELDTGFIHELSMACLRFIQAKTWPKDGRSSALYPASHTSALPTASHVHKYLRAAKLTDTQLEPEHVVALLDLLIYDNEIEKVPVLPALSQQVPCAHSLLDEESDSDASRRGSSRRGCGSSRHRKRARHRVRGSDDDSDSSRTNEHVDAVSYDSGSSGSDARARRRRSIPTRRRRDASSGSSDDTHASDTGAEGLTHVPYVYRAVKRMLRPDGAATTSGYEPLNVGWLQTPYGHCDVLDHGGADGMISAGEGHGEEGTALISGTETPAQVGWLEATLQNAKSVGDTA
ncbi:34-kDa subunit of RNA polymerase III (C) [Malassezia sp. CBS 17886]|nr:34-kDa subunit of RNA polymerase III (C) [Malassezia sp. CBS 17886]